ncbi:replication protein A 32 kDa subunit-like isoform X2 [Hoplias malabaricus]|uniref:replication protein A 32 kDa subunit-like isoform X2 n=1 Tax=Hoplias malabaricus TaxID=27720 RepID=UPI0034630AA3
MGSHGYKHSFSPGESSCLPREGQPKRSGILYILPCTVSQLRSATELRESFFIRDLELNQLSVVGLIRRTKPASEFVLYSLDDMTGAPMDVKQWMNLEDENMNSRFIPPGTYVKVVGSLHSFQHHRSMVAFSVRRLQDLNEITSHMLEVVQTHLFNHNNSGTMREQVLKSLKYLDQIYVMGMPYSLVLKHRFALETALMCRGECLGPVLGFLSLLTAEKHHLEVFRQWRDSKR